MRNSIQERPCICEVQYRRQRCSTLLPIAPRFLRVLQGTLVVGGESSASAHSTSASSTAFVTDDHPKPWQNRAQSGKRAYLTGFPNNCI